MAFSRFSSAFDGRGPFAFEARTGPDRSYAWGPDGPFRGGHHYNPDQPRVPAGHPEGGEWTRDGDGAESPSQDDHRVVSDATPDNSWKPGAQYAQRRAGGRGGFVAPTAGQLARLAAAEARANAAIREIRERDPKWRPQPSLYQTTAGRIAATEADAREAETYLAELMRYGIGPGRFACDWVLARGPGRDFLPLERAEINRIGYTYGCHTCGTRDPGTRWQNFVPDHQPPNSMNTMLMSQQRLYPQCLTCSVDQGVWLSLWRRRQ